MAFHENKNQCQLINLYHVPNVEGVGHCTETRIDEFHIEPPSNLVTNRQVVLVSSHWKIITGNQKKIGNKVLQVH
jgi:hypothetical protein